jgi:Kef-type K+ transport system membrane component KefB
VVGLVIVFGPLVAERLRLPGPLGLLTFGAVIGPNVLDVLARFTGLQAVGSIGVLYLIFLAGLQLDLETFVRTASSPAGSASSRRRSPWLWAPVWRCCSTSIRVPRC